MAELRGDELRVTSADEPLLATLAAASLRTRIASGRHAGERWRRLGDRVEPHDPDTDPEASPRVPEQGGLSLHADVAVPARDRRRLERLCHYVARPPLASDRLEERPDGRLALRLKTRWRDGTTHILMEPHELLEGLVPLIPPPRAHQVRYHGVLAPCASARDGVVPGPRKAPVGAKPAGPGTPTHLFGKLGARRAASFRDPLVPTAFLSTAADGAGRHRSSVSSLRGSMGGMIRTRLVPCSDAMFRGTWVAA